MLSLRDRAEPYFEDAAPAHDWHHVERVAALAESLADDYDADERVLFAAVWLHDIGRSREDSGEIDDHAEWGAVEAADLLADYGTDADTVDAVQHCIRAHRYSNDIEPETIEAKLLCDADNLDALGAVGIGRLFSYGGDLGQPMHDPGRSTDDDPDAGGTQIDHLREKLLSLRDRMYTDAGRKLAAERHAFVADFADRFDREVEGRA